VLVLDKNFRGLGPHGELGPIVRIYQYESAVCSV